MSKQTASLKCNRAFTAEHPISASDLMAASVSAGRSRNEKPVSSTSTASVGSRASTCTHRTWRSGQTASKSGDSRYRATSTSLDRLRPRRTPSRTAASSCVFRRAYRRRFRASAVVPRPSPPPFRSRRRSCRRISRTISRGSTSGVRPLRAKACRRRANSAVGRTMNQA
jgi:hypothetical protein